MQQLTEYGLISEDWGGDTIMVPVSAHKKIGLDELLENILVLAEVQDLKANPNRPAQGVVIEAKLDKGRGPVASVLIQKGTLRVGDTIIVGTAFGKVRAMNNERGERVKKAEPSLPVEILGLNDVPEAGDILNVTDEKTARSVAEKRMEKKRSSELHVNAKVTLDDLFNQIQQGELKELPLIIKGDVQVPSKPQPVLNGHQERRSPHCHRPFRRRRHQRIGYHAGFGFERPHHRL